MPRIAACAVWAAQISGKQRKQDERQNCNVLQRFETFPDRYAAVQAAGRCAISAPLADQTAGTHYAHTREIEFFVVPAVLLIAAFLPLFCRFSIGLTCK